MKAAVYAEKSKKQCIAKGLDPMRVPSFNNMMMEKEIERKRMEYEEVLRVIRKFILKFLSSVKGIPMLVAINDENGYILEFQGDETIRQTIQKLGIKVGIQFNEEDAGANSISLALHYKEPVQMIGTDHYFQILHSTACFTVPFQYLDEKRILGCISVMTLIEYANPLILNLLSTIVDSIERELLLLRQNQKLNLLKQILIDSTRSGIIFTDQNGMVTDLNVLAEQMMGFRRNLVLGTSAMEIQPVGQYIDGVIRKGETYENVEITLNQEDGMGSICLFDALPIYDEQAKVIGTFGQFRDITELKKTEEILRNSEKLSIVGQMAAGVAHEIRNPLTTLKGFLQFLRPEMENKEYVDIMLSELERINTIVSEFLVLAKPQAVHFKQKDLMVILQDSISFFSTQAIMENVGIHLDSEDTILFVNCDENQLKQVFINVLKNGLEAMPHGGKIMVNANRMDNEKVTIRFADEGMGIPAEKLSRLGRPFYTTKENGTGLGLMITQKIIEHHQGDLAIESEVGNGTTVHITLPLIEIDLG